MKLLESTKSKITKDKNGENVSYLEITEGVLIRCNVANNSYQQNSRVLYTFVSNKSFGQLLDILTRKLYIFKNIWFRIFLYWIWFTDQFSNPLEIDSKINITLVIS